MVWKNCCCCRRGNRDEEIEINDNTPKVVDGNSLRSEGSVWKVLGDKMSSWSLPKNMKGEFEHQFDEYLAVDDDVDDDDPTDKEMESDSNSSTLSQLLS